MFLVVRCKLLLQCSKLQTLMVAILVVRGSSLAINGAFLNTVVQCMLVYALEFFSFILCRIQNLQGFVRQRTLEGCATAWCASRLLQLSISDSKLPCLDIYGSVPCYCNTRVFWARCLSVCSAHATMFELVNPSSILLALSLLHCRVLLLFGYVAFTLKIVEEPCQPLLGFKRLDRHLYMHLFGLLASALWNLVGDRRVVDLWACHSGHSLTNIFRKRYMTVTSCRERQIR